ncbi:hypothetical protein [Photobacterium leiognathi]|uniref:hypothetical protein n=1 Tax=Photobacterium leiognathi TaxID=553611 RepID=UPI002982AAE8|nr:hypothetical protein [Photobacterium leiognathi]
MKSQKKLICLSITLALTLTGCGAGDNGSTISGSDDSSSDSGTIPDARGVMITARFIDSAVEGLKYDCQNTGEFGITNSKGEFVIHNNAVCSFSINNLTLGTAIITQQQKKDDIYYITPSSITKSVTNKTENIAALLQTLDSDNNPSNGINLTSFKGKLPSEVLSASAEQFSEIVSSVPGIEKNNIVSFEQAKEHLNNTLKNNELLKGYDSPAVKEIIEGINVLSHKTPQQLLQVNIEDTLNSYKSKIYQAAKDEPLNADIKVLQSLLTITTILNNELVQRNINFNYDGVSDPFNYSDALPQVINFAIQKNGPELKVEDIARLGSTEQEALTLHKLAKQLIDASNYLGTSFTNVNRIAQYDVDNKHTLNYQQAQQLRVIALTVANVLNTSAAYNIGSDEFYLPQQEKVRITGNKYICNEFNEEYGYCKDPTMGSKVTPIVTADFETAGYDPVAIINNPEFMTLRDNGQEYLNTAFDSLKQAANIAATLVDFKQLDFDSKQERTIAKQSIQSLNANLQAKNGNDTPFIHYDNDDGLESKLTVNVQALYHNPLVRNDITITTNKYNCKIDVAASKFADMPMCSISDLNTSTYYSNEDNNGDSYYLYAYPAKHILKIEPTSSKYNNIILSYQEKKDGEWIDMNN